jgi:hypothetical protein
MAMGEEMALRIMETGTPERAFWRKDKDGNVTDIVSLADVDDL